MTEKKLSRAEIGTRIKGLCEDGNVTKLARNLEVSPSFLHEIVKGLKKPSVEILHAIADDFSININWLLTGEGQKYQEQDSLVAPKVAQNQTDPMERALIEMFRGLSSEHKGELLGKAEQCRLSEARPPKTSKKGNAA